MSSKLKAITTRAKQLYKTGKFAKWTDAIKEASKQLTKGKKVSGYEKTEKHGNTTKVVYTVSPKVKKAKKHKTGKTTKQLMIDLYGKNNPLSHYKSLGNIKKKATKKKATPKSYHKDSKSHNVNIRVMSGIDGAVQHLNSLINEKSKALKKIDTMKIVMKQFGDKETINHYKFWINRYKKFVLGLNKQINEAKKHIK